MAAQQIYTTKYVMKSSTLVAGVGFEPTTFRVLATP
jgi:hypothetical protein